MFENPNSVMHSAMRENRIANDIYINMAYALTVIEKCGLSETFEKEILNLKAITKERFLGRTKASCKRWLEIYPEATSIAMELPVARGVRFAKWFLVRGIYLPMLIRMNLYRVKSLFTFKRKQ